MKASEDPNNEGNSEKYHTGKVCIEPNCQNPAGTAWSPVWCFECNVKRMKRISKSLHSMVNEDRREAGGEN